MPSALPGGVEQGSRQQAPCCGVGREKGDRRAVRCRQGDASFGSGSENLSGGREGAWLGRAAEALLPVCRAPVLDFVPFSAEHLELALNCRSVKALRGALGPRRTSRARPCSRAAPQLRPALRGCRGFPSGQSSRWVALSQVGCSLAVLEGACCCQPPGCKGGRSLRSSSQTKQRQKNTYCDDFF